MGTGIEPYPERPHRRARPLRSPYGQREAVRQPGRTLADRTATPGGRLLSVGDRTVRLRPGRSVRP